jgi:membrane protein implicated in regulation of membrane protease activity
METFYLVCAVVGGTVLVVQTVLLAFGAGHGDADMSADEVHVGDVHGAEHGHGLDEGVFLKLLSLKTIVAFLTFFGLAGLATLKAGWEPLASLAVAVVAGTLALFLVAWLMSLLSHLRSEGNVNLGNAVGQVGRVYLTIPASRASAGKVTVSVQGRSVEAKAVTSGGAIPTGSQVRVVGLSAPDTLEVQRSENA